MRLIKVSEAFAGERSERQSSEVQRGWKVENFETLAPKLDEELFLRYQYARSHASSPDSLFTGRRAGTR